MATYKLIGARYLRKFTAAKPTPTYAAETDAANIVDRLCEVPWERVATRDATMTSHSSEKSTRGTVEKPGLDWNVDDRDSFDAAVWCSNHTGGNHTAYANAACYVYALPTMATYPNITGVSVKATSDPYNVSGLRIAVMTSDTLAIPTACNTCRTGDFHADGVAPHKVVTDPTSSAVSWYPKTVDQALAPAATLALKKYLFVFVLKESYAETRGNWLEGSGFIKNLVEITTSSDITGWSDGATIDLSAESEPVTYNIIRGGVYPENFTTETGFESVSVQRTGDPFVQEVNPAGGIASGLYSLFGERYESVFEIPHDQVTCMHSILVNTATSEPRRLIVIGGTFTGGTFAEIPGLYFYDPVNEKFITGCSLGEYNEPSLATFAAYHGGFACVINTCTGSNFSVGFIACDGSSFTITELGGIGSGSTPVPFLTMQFDSEAVTLSVTGKSCLGSTNIQFCNIFNYNNWGLLSRGVRIVDATPMIEQSNHLNPQAYSYYYAATVKLVALLDSGSKLGVISYGVSKYYDTGSSRAVAVGSAFKSEVSLSGTFGSARIIGMGKSSGEPFVRSIGVIAVSGGTDLVVGSVSCASGIAQIVDNHYLDYSSGLGYETGFSNVTISRPSWSTALAPSVITNLSVTKVFPLFSNAGSVPLWFEAVASSVHTRTRISNDDSRILVTGAFTTINGQTRPGSAFVRIAANESISESSDGPGIAAMWSQARPTFLLGSYYGKSFVALPASSSGGEVYYRFLHTGTTDAQSAIGLRTLVAKARERLDVVKLPIGALNGSGSRLGAMFLLRGDTIALNRMSSQGQIVSVNVPTWQLIASRLAVPFAIPQGFSSGKIKLDWSALTATAGSKLNVWWRDGYTSDANPDVDDYGIYEAIDPSVSGWSLVGTVDATLTTATLDFNPNGAREVTLLFTAFVPTDFNPSSGMTIPIGVGAATVGVDGKTATNTGSGWKPNIQLIG